MFSRVISLVLIAAVTACPLWCNIGICGVAGSCCGGNFGDRNTRESAPVASCCNTKMPAAALDAAFEDTAASNNHQPAPDDPPTRSKSSRHCICGGAVLQVSCSWAEPIVSSAISQNTCDNSHHSPAAQIRSKAFDFPECVRAKNQGRFKRTLYGSFIC
jgi:hypothetical protein